MRLAPLLAQYLYIHKRLDLPGLGSFLMDTSATDESESSRHNKSGLTDKISFEANSQIKDSPELITFISAQTGKIKALAAADLDSHLELAHQFLNIGKPFSLEGIGNLVKVKAGVFEFTPGPAIAELKKEQALKEHQHTNQAEDNPADYNYKNIFYPKKVRARWKKPLVIFLLVGGLALAIWGGYTVYKRTAARKENGNVKKDKELPVVSDDTLTKQPADTAVITKTNPVIVTAPGSYKFVLETTNRERAMTRFSRLKTFQWDVYMETRDSVQFKIFMILPAKASDTTRIIDSLTMLTGKRVRIE